MGQDFQIAGLQGLRMDARAPYLRGVEEDGFHDCDPQGEGIVRGTCCRGFEQSNAAQRNIQHCL